VKINIGLLEWRDSEMTLKAKRGKRITLKVNNKDDALNIRIKAQQKWIQFYPNLYNVERDYLLLYESGELIENLVAAIPGRN